MNSRTRILTIALAAVCLASCGGGSQPAGEEHSNTVKKPRQGDVRDAHGCLTSMGYVWSGARDTCIRLWESATEMVPTNRSELVVYAVVSDDKKKAEIFVPDDSAFMLRGNGGSSFTVDSFTLTVNGNKYLLTKNGKPIYQTAQPEAATAEPAPRQKKKRR